MVKFVSPRVKQKRLMQSCQRFIDKVTHVFDLHFSEEGQVIKDSTNNKESLTNKATFALPSLLSGIISIESFFLTRSLTIFKKYSKEFKSIDNSAFAQASDKMDHAMHHYSQFGSKFGNLTKYEPKQVYQPIMELLHELFAFRVELYNVYYQECVPLYQAKSYAHVNCSELEAKFLIDSATVIMQVEKEVPLLTDLLRLSLVLTGIFVGYNTTALVNSQFWALKSGLLTEPENLELMHVLEELDSLERPTTKVLRSLERYTIQE